MLLQNWPIYSLVVSISLSLCSASPVFAQNSASVGSTTAQAEEDVPSPGSVQVPSPFAVQIPRQAVAQLPGETQSSQAPPAKLPEADPDTNTVPLRGIGSPNAPPGDFIPIPTAESTSQPAGEPVRLKSTELLRRYLEQLSRRHGIAPPGPNVITRADLGQYFLKVMPLYAGLPADQLSQQDLSDIGMMTDEFSDALWQVKGTMALRAFKAPLAESEALASKVAEAHSRLSVLEKVKVNGDFTFLPQSDMGRGDRDSTTANLRARINFLARVHEAKSNEKLGDGYLFARLTAAAGRFFPRNKYLLSPFNDVVDANASPFNSGPQ